MLSLAAALALAAFTNPAQAYTWGFQWFDLDLPDLECYGYWHPDHQQEYFVVRVENVGDASSAGTWLDVYTSDDPDDVSDIQPGEPGDDYVWIKPLAPGASLEYVFYYPADLLAEVVATQDYPFLYNACQIDTFGAILEWDESNNITSWYDQIYPDLLQD